MAYFNFRDYTGLDSGFKLQQQRTYTNYCPITVILEGYKV